MAESTTFALCSSEGCAPTRSFVQKHPITLRHVRFPRTIPKALGNREDNGRRRYSLRATSSPPRASVSPETHLGVGATSADASEVLDELVSWLRRELPRLFVDGVGGTHDGKVERHSEDHERQSEQLEYSAHNMSARRSVAAKHTQLVCLTPSVPSSLFAT